MAIETYCTAQDWTPELTAPPRSAGAACAGGGDCDTSACAGIRGVSFCTIECASSAECPAAIPRCVDSSAGIRICIPACDAGESVASCVAAMEMELDLATSQRCLAEYDAYTACLAGGARFCTADDEDSACGVESGRYMACRMPL